MSAATLVRRPIAVLMVDDHVYLRDGITALLQNHPEFRVVGEATDGQDAMAQFERLRPDVTLMDLQMPNMSGIAAIEGIRRDFPDARIVALTSYRGDAQALRALRAGAIGYVLKNSLRAELLDAIRAAHAGTRYLSAEVATELAAYVASEELTPREIDVLRTVAQGHSNKAVAARLGLTEDTVKTHLKSIFAKLIANDRTHAVTIALKRGIIEP